MDRSVIVFLIECGASTETRSSEGKTALHYAALVDSPPIAQLLLQLGADVDVRDATLSTALHYSVSLSTARVLVSSGAALGVSNERGETSEHMFRGNEADMAALQIATLAFDGDGDGDNENLVQTPWHGVARQRCLFCASMVDWDEARESIKPCSNEFCCENCYALMKGRPSALLWIDATCPGPVEAA